MPGAVGGTQWEICRDAGVLQLFPAIGTQPIVCGVGAGWIRDAGSVGACRWISSRLRRAGAVQHGGRAGIDGQFVVQRTDGERAKILLAAPSVVVELYVVALARRFNRLAV